MTTARLIESNSPIFPLFWGIWPKAMTVGPYRNALGAGAVRRRGTVVADCLRHPDDAGIPVCFRQKQLADRVDGTQGMISHIERGHSDYSGHVLELLADALNCQPADLLGRNPLDPEAPWSLWESLSPQERGRQWR